MFSIVTLAVLYMWVLKSMCGVVRLFAPLVIVLNTDALLCLLTCIKHEMAHSKKNGMAWMCVDRNSALADKSQKTKVECEMKPWKNQMAKITTKKKVIFKPKTYSINKLIRRKKYYKERLLLPTIQYSKQIRSNKWLINRDTGKTVILWQLVCQKIFCITFYVYI